MFIYKHFINICDINMLEIHMEYMNPYGVYESIWTSNEIKQN